METLQRILYKCILQAGKDYLSYTNILDLSSKTRQVLFFYRDTPYRVGTYRTDFVYDSSGNERIIEITCRFALNAIFLTFVYNRMAETHASSHPEWGPCEPTGSNAVIQHFAHLLAGKDRICLLRGSDLRNESRLFVSVFEAANIPVEILEPDQIIHHENLLRDAWVISELTLDEILGLPDQAHEILSSCRMTNDFRTVLLAHDKQFFALLGHEPFLQSALTSEERRFLSHFYLPTYTRIQEPEAWASAFLSPEKWVLKHRSLGKSVEIFAGSTLPLSEWKSLWNREDFDSFVLQEWINTRAFPCCLGETNYHDYLAGTLLFFDDNYFGFGVFRGSSFPITNRVDDRKGFSLIYPDQVAATLLEKQHGIPMAHTPDSYCRTSLPRVNS